MNRESFRGTEKAFYLKELKCFTPERAQIMGFLTEVPIFASPFTPDKKTCDECGSNYGPILYVSGEVVQTQHPAHKLDGGIYLTEYGHEDYPNYKKNGKLPFSRWGWISEVEPLGMIVGGHEVRCEGVKVGGMKAHCVKCDDHFPSGILAEGVVIEKDNFPGTLVPLCGIENHPELADRVRFNFRIAEDGHVLFGNLK